MTKRLVVIDGKSVFYRGYYAMPNLSTRDGTPTGGVYGFAALSLELIKKLKPDYVAVAWDKPKTNIRKRLEIYSKYKAGRKPAPPDFYVQIPILHELLDAFGWPLYECDDYEADDIMATLAHKAEKEGIETCLITSDLDALQSISPLTHVYAMKKGLTNIELFHPESFTEKYGLRVDQFLDLKSLKGDASDGIPGVPGIGEKTGIQLLQDYDTLDGVYRNLDKLKPTVRAKLEAGKESAYMSHEIAELWTDAPVSLELDELDVNKLDTAKLRDMLIRLEFRSLLKNLPEHMQTDQQTKFDEIIRSNLTPVKLIDFDAKYRVKLTMAEHVVAYLDQEKIYISPEPGEASIVSPDDIKDMIASLNIITHSAGDLLHFLFSHFPFPISQPPFITHDTRQAAFLIDPLRRSRDLVDLVAVEEITPELAVSAIWSVYDDQTKSLKALPGVARVAREMDFPLIPVLARMEHRGIILDTAQLAEMNKDLTRDIADVQKRMYEMAGYDFNISSPAQLGEVLFTKLQLPTDGIKKGKTGYSTGQKELDKLRGQHPIIELIEQYRELTKLQNTYVEALPKLVDKNSRIHTTFNQDVAATGRLSSTDPNLQNIPIRTELGRKIRDAFVPEKGNVFVSADYSQFELRLAAVLAGDQQMIDDFNSDIDIHTKTASDVYKIPYDEVTKDQRRDAKVINFGVLYGMGPHALAQNTGMSFGDAKKFIDEYFRLRAPIRAFIDATIEKAKTEGYVETLFGRRRPTPDVRSSNFIVRSSAERAAANMPIQGTEADLMKMAMLAVEEKLGSWEVRKLGSDEAKGSESRVPLTEQSGNILGWQVLQIHDSILIECPAENASIVSDILKETMENIYPKLGIKLKVDVHTGVNWGEV